MIKYTSADQLTIEKFKTPFEINLYRYNRLVKLSQIIPWDDCEVIETKEEQTIGNNIEGKFGQEKQLTTGHEFTQRKVVRVGAFALCFR